MREQLERAPGMREIVSWAGLEPANPYLKDTVRDRFAFHDMAHTMGDDPTTVRSTTGCSTVELRVHGGRQTNRTPSAHHAPTVFGTARAPLPGTFQESLEPAARVELAAY